MMFPYSDGFSPKPCPPGPGTPNDPAPTSGH